MVGVMVAITIDMEDITKLNLESRNIYHVNISQNGMKEKCNLN